MLKQLGEMIRGKQTGAGDVPASDRGFPWDVAAVLAFSLICMLPYYHLPPSEVDEGLITVGAERILRGQIPYRDFFSELGPASFYLQAVIFKMVGLNVTAARLTAWLLGGAISGLIYLLARRLMPGFRALLTSSIFVLVVYPSCYYLSHHWWGNLFLLLMVLSVLKSLPRAPEEIETRDKVWLFLAGVLATMTLVSMQTKGIWAIAMTSAFLITHPWLAGRRTWQGAVGLGCRHAAWFLAGAAASIGTVAGYFVYHGAASAWLEDNFSFLLANYWTYAVEVPHTSALQTLIHFGHLALTQWSVHFNFYFINIVFFLFLAPTLAFGGTAWQLLSARRPQRSEARILLLYLFEGLGAFFSEFHAHDEYHLAVAAPLMLVLLVYQWGSMTRGRGALSLLAKATALTAVAFMLTFAAHKANNALHVDAPVETRRGVLYVRPTALEQTREVINAIQQRVPPGGETFVYPYVAELYFYTATRNPTRFDVLLPEFHSPAQVDETIARLRSARPKFIFSFEKIQRWKIRAHFPDDPPDAVFPHPVGKALAAPGSGYHLDGTFESGYSTVQGKIAEVAVWAADK